MFSSGPAEDAAAAKRAGLEKGYGQLSGLYGQGREALTSNYTDALEPYQELYGKSMGGFDAYGDATGANGPEGLARAKQNFQAGPGYQFQMDQGIDALSRAGVARGQATGNTLQDAQKFGSGLASQEYGNYVSRLQPFLSGASGAATGIAGVKTGLGSGLNQSFMGQGQGAFNTQKGIGEADADAAMADYNASANLWNFGLNAAKTAASFIPGGGGGGSTRPRVGPFG